MSKIEALLKNEKVEWKKLWEITAWDKKFNGIEKFKQHKIKKYHYYLSNQLKELSSEKGTIKILTTNKTELYASEESVKDNISEGEIVCIPWGGNPIVQYYKGKFITGDNRIATSLDTDKLNNKFLYYTLLNKLDLIASFYRGSGIKHPDMYKILDLEIPIPSIKTQEKIVKILDTFTALTTELIAGIGTELTLRQKQYEYYRDMLLSEEYLNKLSENPYIMQEYLVNIITLGEIGEIQMCKRILKEQTSSHGEVPFYKIGTFGKTADSFITQKLFNEYKEKYNYPKKGEVLISASGTIGRTVIFDGKDAYFQDSNIVWISHNEEIVLNKYLFYLYQTINWNPSTGGTINRLYNYNLKNIKVALPSIEIQNKVVEILDAFQAMAHQVSGLLPKERELRKKQYEYYREKLLNFGTEFAERERERIIPDAYFVLVKEAADIVGVKLFEVEWKMLGEVSEINRGASPRPISKYITDNIDGIPWIKIGDINANSKYVTSTKQKISVDGAKKSKVLKKGDFIMSNSMSYGRPYILEIDGAIHDGWASISNFDDYLNSDFLYHYLSTSMVKDYWEKKINTSSVSNLNSEIIGSLKVPLIDKNLQKNIAKKLDALHMLVNSISEGLPKEIAQRQKQYEYYREKLLDFPK